MFLKVFEQRFSDDGDDGFPIRVETSSAKHSSWAH